MKKIILADDEPEALEILTEFLTESNYIVRAVDNGAMLLSALEIEKYDLVLLDLDMPILGGVDVLEELKNKNIDIPVMIMSGYDDGDDLKDCLKKYNIQCFVSKPINLFDLLEKIDAIWP